MLYGAVIYMGDVLFQYSEGDSRYTEFIGNPAGIIFVATSRDHKCLLSQRSNTPNMSSSKNNFRWLNASENSSNLIKIAPASPGDISDPPYHVQERDGDTEYKGRVKIMLSTHV